MKSYTGELYWAGDPQLLAERRSTRKLMRRYNHEIDYEDEPTKLSVLKEMGITFDAQHPPFFEPPLFLDYGYNITVGKEFYCNFNTTFLDICPITIGDRVMLAPGVQLYAAFHPQHAATRNGGLKPELGAPITIEDDVWVGGSAVILPGVTIGARSIIAAGAVVTKNVEPDTVVGGNPARVIKRLDPNQAAA
ncbi:Maltose O-acetyltransferase [Auxenochlorella protothecoides]|uniref:Maltose O-acetyltransferase n=1 Tax=Auxenochlorella protothecoides TaxID=3075 RepID=A0A087SNM8_AUXPR|nr:Maltose O-acetyltransferase [Auxenochlorella protothecoides]KFM27332.1 Maltose O-acetyltransferase [Auxenochlorella protothecoides]